MKLSCTSRHIIRQSAFLSSPPKPRATRLRPTSALPEALHAFALEASQPHPGILYGAACNSLVFTLGFKVLRKGLTVEGVAHAWALGAGTWAAFGPAGYALVCLYFIFGTLVRVWLNDRVGKP